MKTTTMIRTSTLLPFLPLFGTITAALDVDPYHHVKDFHLDDLRYGLRDAEIAKDLRSTGMIAVPMDSHFSHDRQLALDTLCRCWKEEHALRTIMTDNDESTTFWRNGEMSRITLATKTIGRTPLELPSSWTESYGPDAIETLEALRDDVAAASDAFITALDRLLHGTMIKENLLENLYGGHYATIDEIVQASTHLEHFHSYTKGATDKSLGTEDATSAVHTSAGLFSAFVPSYSCLAASGEAFYVQEGDVLRRAILPSNSVIMMLGYGAEHWLDSNFGLKATRYAVHLPPGESRSWYGMMHMVPDSAIVQEHPARRTFADLRKAMTVARSTMEQYRSSHQQDGNVVHFSDDGEYLSYPWIEDIFVGSSSSTRASLSRRRHRHRRRLQMVSDASTCNNVTNFYCSMSCMEIPERPHSHDTNMDYSLYCVDSSVLASTESVYNAVRACNDDNGVVGGAMNGFCSGSWHPTILGLPGQTFSPTTPEEDKVEEEPFCTGGASMSMNGFQWTSDTCIIFINPDWILTTLGKLVAACAGSLLLGGFMEFLMLQRRLVSDIYYPGPKRLVSSAFLYVLELILGYGLMLVVMTYSIPLFASIVAGMVGGHILFTAKDALLGSRYESVNLHLPNDGSEKTHPAPVFDHDINRPEESNNNHHHIIEIDEDGSVA